MLKPIAIGVLSMAAACTGAAFAGDHSNPDFYNQSWNQPTFTQQQLQQMFADGWEQILDSPQFQSYCTKYPRQCAQWEQWLNSWGNWKPPSQGGGNPQPAPEVDPAGAMGALTMLGAVLVMVRGRRRAGKPA